MNLNSNFQCIFVLFVLVLAVQARHFCEYYPLSRRCAGAFASGGKRSLYESESGLQSFDTYNMKNKRIETELKNQELRDLMDYFYIEKQLKDLNVNDEFKNTLVEDESNHEIKKNEEIILLKALLEPFNDKAK